MVKMLRKHVCAFFLIRVLWLQSYISDNFKRILRIELHCISKLLNTYEMQKNEIIDTCLYFSILKLCMYILEKKNRFLMMLEMC